LHTSPNLTLTTGAMWGPALAAFITTWLFGGRVRDLAWGWGDGRWQWRAYFIPFLYAVPVYLVAWVTGLGGFFNPAAATKVAADYGLTALAPGAAFAVYAVISLTAGFVPKTGRALGEEIGWRGFLVPELMKVTGFTGTSIISGLMWSAWHYPAILFGDYNAGTPAWFGLGCFTAAVTAQSFIYTWLTRRSRSLWPAAFLHGAHNMLIQLVLTPATRDTGRTAWFIDEFGLGLVVTSIIAAVIVWWKQAAEEAAARAGK
jgi:membrane protease YdiL (CAAX protease family)